MKPRTAAETLRERARSSCSGVRSKCPWHCHMYVCVCVCVSVCVPVCVLIWFGSTAFGMAAIIQQKLLTIMAHQPYNIPSNKAVWGRGRGRSNACVGSRTGRGQANKLRIMRLKYYLSRRSASLGDFMCFLFHFSFRYQIDFLFF